MSMLSRNRGAAVSRDIRSSVLHRAVRGVVQSLRRSAADRSRLREAGGIHYRVDELERRMMFATQLPFVPESPTGARLYGATAIDRIDDVAEVDEFEVRLESGKTLSARVLPAFNSVLKPTLTIIDDQGDVVVSRTAFTGGQAAVLQRYELPAGTYTIQVSGADATSGKYELKALLNSGFEEEALGAAGNDTPGTAVSLNEETVLLQGSGRINNISGQADGRTKSDQYRIDLSAGESLGAFLRTGDQGFGQFNFEDMYETLPEVYAVANGDFNGDGLDDIVLGGSGSGSNAGVKVLLSNGTGGFDTIDWGADFTVYDLTVGDFNDDGHLDIATLGQWFGAGGYYDPQSGQETRLTYFFGDGEGNRDFTHDQIIAAAYSIASGDINNDGRDDLAIGNFEYQTDPDEGGSFTLILSNESGGFDGPRRYSTDHRVFDIQVVDFDNDGFGEVLTAEGSDVEIDGYRGAIGQYFFDHDGFWVNRLGYHQQDTRMIRVAAARGDNGVLTIVGLHLDSDYGQVTGLLVDANGDVYSGFGQYAQQYPFEYRAGLQLADVNRDGWIDLLTSSGYPYGSENDNQINLNLGDESNSFFAGGSGYSMVSTVGAFTVADLNADGDVDLVSVSSQSFYNSDEQYDYSRLGIRLGKGEIRLELRNAAGETLLVANGGGFQAEQAILDFIASATGSYYLHVSGDYGQNYQLAVTGGAKFGIDPDNWDGRDQTISTARQVAARIDYTSDYERYKLSLTAGDLINAVVQARDLWAGDTLNNLKPVLRLYDPEGNLVASDLNAAGLRDAMFSHTATITGFYTLEVAGDGSTYGDYDVRVTGNTGALPPFTLRSRPDIPNYSPTSPRIGEVIDYRPYVYMELSAPVLASSVQATDILINGQPASAVYEVRGDTIQFRSDAQFATDGVYTITIPAGAIISSLGVPNDLITYQITVDANGPRVISSSIAPNQVFEPGPVTWNVGFNEGLRTIAIAGWEGYTILDNGDVRTTNLSNGQTVPLSQMVRMNDDVNGDPTVLDLIYNYLPEGLYEGRLLSGFYNFSSQYAGNIGGFRGNDLDGEPNPALPSGDGNRGGDYYQQFIVDAAGITPLTGLTALSPMGSLVHELSTVRAFHGTGDVDSFSINLDSNQQISLMLIPSSGSSASIKLDLKDPSGNLIGTTTGAGGDKLLLQSIIGTAGGTYQIDAASLSGLAGYTLRVVVGAAVEEESVGAPSNNSRASAQALVSRPIATGFAGLRAGLVGEAETGAEDFYRIELTAGQAASIALSGIDGGTAEFRLEDASGNLITRGASGQFNADRTAIDFIAPSTGTFYVVVSGAGRYSLLTTQNASYERESQEAAVVPQDLSVTGQALGHLKGGPVSSREIKVLQIGQSHQDFGGDLNRLVNQLNDDTYANFTATRTTYDGADTIGELAPYDVVLLTQTTSSYFTPGLAAALRRYVELGGALVVLGATIQSLGSSALTGLRPVLPFDVTKGTTSVSGMVTPVGTHPITAGIAADNLFSTQYTPIVAGILSGATVVANSANGAPAVLVRENIGFGGRVVTLAPVYADQYNNDSNLRGGLGDRLLEQTLMWAAGSGDQRDSYALSVNAGDTITLTTSLPQSETALPANELDPVIELYSAAGVLLATNDNGPDGLNARLVYTVPAGQGGTYRVVVRAAGFEGGAYSLQATGATGSALVIGPRVIATTPKQGNVSAAPTTTIDLDLSEGILASSVQASDLTVVGGSVTGVQMVDGDTVRFTISVPNVDATYNYTLAAGAFRDLQGDLSEAYAGNFVVDKRGPYIVSATPSTQASSPFTTWTFTFNEPITIPSSYNYEQLFQVTGPNGVLESWRFNNPIVNGNTFTLTFQPQTVAGTYTAIIKPGFIRDLVGNLMDQDQDGAGGETAQDQYSRSITLASPNLVVDSVQLLNTPVFGSPVTVQWTVRNNGTDPAADGWADRVYLSTDNVVDDSDLVLLTIGTPTLPLAPGQTYTRTQTINLPLNVNLTPGSYRFIVRTDRANTQAESSETDNTNSTAATTVALPPLPDLAVSNVEVISPANPASGQPATVRWTLTNLGTAAVSGVIREQLLLSADAAVGTDVDLGTVDFAVNLAPGASVTRTQAVNLPVNQFGQKYFIVRTDAANSVFEHVQEANNTGISGAVDVSLSPVPDLIVSNITAPASAQSGTTQTITWVLANQGSGDFTGTINENIYLSDDAVIGGDELFKSVTFTGTIAAGQVITRSETITLPINYAGPKRVVIQTDANNQVFENTGENNNFSIDDTVMEVTLPPLPDLLVTSITAPASSLSGRSVPVSWTIRNDGPVAFTGTFEQAVALSSDAVIGNDQNFASFTFTGTILPGQVITQSHTINLPNVFSGNYRVVVTADSGNAVFENTNEGNNTLLDDVEMVVTQAAYPNLTVESITVPPTAQSEEQVDIRWVVRNQGSGATSSPEWYDNIYISSLPVFDSTALQLARVRNASYLNGGDPYEQTQTVTLPRGLQGDYYIYVLTDSGNQVFEYAPSGDAESDNRAMSSAIAITLSPPPDLRVTHVVAPLVAFSGEVTTVSWIVANNGLGATKPGQTAWVDSVYLSTDTTFSAEDVQLGSFTHTGALAAGATYAAEGSVRLPIGISGNYYFIVRTDTGDAVYEDAFEANNATAETSVTEVLLAAPPDLAVTSITAPTVGTAGRGITVDFTVVNEGSSATPTNSWSDRLYLSPTPTLEAETAILLGNRGHYGALAAGGSYSDRFASAIPLNLEGQYYVFVATDAGGDIFELDNANNNVHAVGTIGITQQFADLQIGSFNPPATAEAGAFTPMSWTINNTGVGDTIVGQWTDRIVLSSDNVLGNGDDVYLADGVHNGLIAGGGSYTTTQPVAIPAYVPAGTYNLFLTADLFQQVHETSETNNTNALTPVPITITRQTADLQVTGVTAPGSAGGGQAIPVSFTVGNLGTAATNATSWVDELYLSTDATIGSTDLLVGQIQRTNVLSAGGSYTVNTTVTLPDVSGVFYIIARTDRGNQVVEAGLDGNNDRASSSIAVGEQFLPDLKVSSVVAPAEANAGQSAAVTWTVLNDGASISSSMWYDTVYLSRDTTLDRTDSALGSFQRNGSLGAGASYSDTQTVALPPGLSGEFYFIVSTDNSNRIYERNNESNNTGFNPAGTTLRLLPPADLVAGLITLPAGTYAPGSDVSITYEVTNGSSEPAVGRWADSLYISSDPVWDIGDKLFGRVDHVGDVAGGASYSHTLTAPLPGVLSGAYYVIVRSDIRNQIAESNESNNLSASLTNVLIDVPELTLGAPAAGTIAQGKSVYYRVTVGEGETLLVELDAAAANGSTQLYVKRNGVPSRSDFDFGYTDALSPDQKVVVPRTEAGTYYILAYGDSLTAPTNYSIEARALQFEVIDTHYGIGGNGGKLTLQINGAKFDRTITPTLVSPGGGERAAERVFYTSSTRLYATFDLAGLTPNAYDVKLTKSGGAAFSVPDALQVVPARVAKASPVIFGPAITGRGALFQFTVAWGNDGINDVPAPYLVVGADRPIGRNPQFVDKSRYTFIGIAQDDGPAGVIRPNQTAQQEFYARNGQAGEAIELFADRLAEERLDQPFDWSTIYDLLQPPGYSDELFEQIFDQMLADIGPTWGDFAAAVGDAASLLPAEMGNNTLASAALHVNVLKASAKLTTSISGRIFAPDIEVPIAGQQVVARNADTNELVTTTTLNDGSFIFDRLAPGTYQFAYGAGSVIAGGEVTVGLNQHLTGHVVAVEQGGAVSGVVRKVAGNEAVAGATVSAVGEDGTTSFFLTNDAGAYSLVGLEAGTYTLYVDAPGMARSRVEGVTIDPDQPASQNFGLVPEAILNGTVQSPVGPATPLVVTARQVGEPAGPATFFNATVVGGTYQFAMLPAGVFEIVATREGYAPVTQLVTVSAGQTLSAPLMQLARGGTVSGQLTSNAPGFDVGPGTPVSLFLGDTLVASTVTNGDGSFQIDNVQAGTYTARIQTLGEGFATEPTVVVTAGGTTSGVSLQVSPGGLISGTVTESLSSLPVAGVIVYLTLPNGKERVTSTDANGNYSFAKLPLGVYTLSTTNVHQQATVSTLNGTAVDMDLQLPVAASISGQLRRADSAPLVGRVVAMLDGKRVATAYTDESGHYTLKFAAAGTFDLIAESADGAFVPRTSLSVAQGEELTQDFVAGTAQLRLTVTDSVQAVGGASVLLSLQTPFGDSSGTGGVVAEDGTVLLSNLVPGTYELQIASPNNRGLRQIVVVTAGMTDLGAVALSNQAKVSGVVQAGGVPVAGATVSLIEGSGPTAIVHSALTDASGAYLIEYVPAASYTLVVSKAGFKPYVQTNLAVANGQAVSADVPLTAGTSLLTGTVVDPSGRPIVGAAAVLKDPVTGIAIAQTVTQADGLFSFSGAVGNNLTLTIEAADGSRVEVTGITLADGTTNPLGSLSATPIGYVTTHVQSAAGLRVLSLGSSSQQGGFNLSNFELPPLLPPPPNTSWLGAMLNNLNDLQRRPDEPKRSDVPKVDKCQECINNWTKVQNEITFTISRWQAVQNYKAEFIRAKDQTITFLALDLIDFAQTFVSIAATVESLALAAGKATIQVTSRAAMKIAQSAAAYVGAATTFVGAARAMTEVNSVEALFNTARQFVVQLNAFGSALMQIVVDLKAFAGPASQYYQSAGLLGVLSLLIDIQGTWDNLTFADFRNSLDELNSSLEYFRDAYYGERGYIKQVVRAKIELQMYQLCLDNASQNCDGTHDNPFAIKDYVRLVPVFNPTDPNDIIGPAGFGPQKFVPASVPLDYRIRFENDPNATAPAQVVTITQTLDSNLDARTFRLGDFGFGGQFFDVPADSSFYQTRLDLRESRGIYLDVVAGIDLVNRQAFWRFISIDPATGDVPANPLLGFLPTNVQSPEGEGFVQYIIRPNAGAQSGDVIDAIATIIFDKEAPIDTPAIFNTLDALMPGSAVGALPAASASDFIVFWNGDDDANGSAIATFDIYVSDNAGEYKLWLDNTDLRQAVYTGQAGHTYSFYSVAVDNAGNVEAAPLTPDATTTIASTNAPPAVDLDETAATIDEGFVFTRDGLATDPDAGDVLAAEVDYGDGAGFVPLTLNPDGTFSLSHAYADNGSYGVTVRVTDAALVATQKTINVTVNNVDPGLAPVVDQVIVWDGSGGNFVLDGVFTDPSLADTFTGAVDFGAGFVPLTLNADKTYQLNHRFTAPGLYAVTVRITDDDGGIGTHTFNVRLLPPKPTATALRVNDGNAQRSMVKTLTVTFDQPITALPASALTLTLRTPTGPQTVGVTLATAQADGTGKVWTISFSGTGLEGGSLADGVYDLAINGALVTDSFGQTMAANASFSFHRLFADVDGDRDTDGVDIAALRRIQGKPASYNWYFDSDSDGDVDQTDYIAGSLRLTKRLFA